MILVNLAEKFKELKDKKKVLEDELKQVNADLEQAEQALIQEMLNEEIPSFQHAGFSFSVSVKVYASPIADKKEALFAALKENGYGSLVIETVNSNTLSAFIREQLQDRKSVV